MKGGTARLTYIGHATVLIELDGVRLLTDPVLRRRVAHLRRTGPEIDPDWTRDIDAVLVSHLHWDHADVPSLRRLGAATRLIVPRGGGAVFQRRGFLRVEELGAGDTTRIMSLTVTATPAVHSGRRPPLGPVAEAVGFLVEGSRRIYFAGDTDLFSEMASLGKLDVALLPVSGWGATLPPGHLNPRTAAEALKRLQPGTAIPIHWGALRAMTLRRETSGDGVEPELLFAEHAAALAPEVEVRILRPGGSTEIAPNR